MPSCGPEAAVPWNIGDANARMNESDILALLSLSAQLPWDQLEACCYDPDSASGLVLLPAFTRGLIEGGAATRTLALIINPERRPEAMRKLTARLGTTES